MRSIFINTLLIIIYKSKNQFNYPLRASTPLAISINSLVMAS